MRNISVSNVSKDKINVLWILGFLKTFYHNNEKIFYNPVKWRTIIIKFFPPVRRLDSGNSELAELKTYENANFDVIIKLKNRFLEVKSTYKYRLF